MPFPQTPLAVYVDIAPGASPTGTVDSWDPFWVDVTNDARVDQGIEIEEGIPDEANQADPGSCLVKLNNGLSKVTASLGVAGVYSPRNALGTHYGKLAKNTPLRVRINRLTDTFTRTVGVGLGTSDNGITWSNAISTFSVDGSRANVSLPANSSVLTTAVNAGSWDFDMTGQVRVNAAVTGGAYGHQVNFRRNGTTNFYTFYMDWTTAGNMNLFMQRTIASVQVTIGSNAFGAVSAATDYSFRLKAEGGFIGAKFWLSSGSEPTSWNISLSDQGAYNLDSNALGTNIQLATLRFAGNVNTTIGYWDNLVINQYLFVGTVPQWPVRWDKSGNDSWVQVKATGVLRRLQQGQSPIKAPLYSYLDQFSPAGLWTLDDESGAITAASQTPGVNGAYIYSTTPSGWNTPKLGGTSGQYTVAVDTTISGVLPRMVPVTGWSFLFAFYLPAYPAANTVIFRVRSSGTIAQWDVMISPSLGGVLYIIGTLADGTIVVNVSVGINQARWLIGQVEVEQVGGNVTGRIVYYDTVAGTAGGFTSPGVAGTIGSPNSWALYGSTSWQAAAAGPIVFYAKMSPVSASTLIRAANGFAGEDTATRLARLALEAGVRLDMLTAARTPSLLGVQSSDTFLNVMGEGADTDLGLLTEFRGGLRYRPRDRRYNQFARMTLDFATGQIAEPPEPTEDDRALRNDVTVSRKNGSSARAIDSTSIAANGRYDTEYALNPSTDDVLLAHASFRLYLGTWSDLRWPVIVLDIARNATTSNFIERASSLDAGARIVINNPPSNLPVGQLNLLVESVKMSIDPYKWRVILSCAPYGPWMISDSSDTGTLNRVDLNGSTLNSTEAATALLATDTWTIANTLGNWDTTQVPFNWMVNGEVVTVTALSGTTSQTATVTRGVNGISKAHAIGEQIHLASIMYVAL